MITLSVLIQHSGQWDENNRFEDYIMDEVVTNIDIDFYRFILLIATQLGVDISTNSSETQYEIDVDSLPMMIQNNMGLRVYFELKKQSGNFKDYPLCITWRPIDIHGGFPINEVETHYNTNCENSSIDTTPLLGYIDEPECKASNNEKSDTIDCVTDKIPAEGHILPLAYEIVDSENNAS
ncbi:hypothetical protein HAX54_018746 [Datura stramonium]|uniref:Uncharacterized protein n=1 Tax=Datura stramonium TaxID=4076 RepID=A0ABS8UMW6_DATST|nr:hypothetical protein [Datura stramonium]